MLVMVLTIGALILSVAVKLIVSMATIKAIALFFGLEGTVLLASALSPPRDDLILIAREFEFQQIRPGILQPRVEWQSSHC